MATGVISESESDRRRVQILQSVLLCSAAPPRGHSGVTEVTPPPPPLVEKPPPSLPLIGKWGSDMASESSLPVHGCSSRAVSCVLSQVILPHSGRQSLQKENKYQIIANKQLVYFDHLGRIRCVDQRCGRSSNRLLPLGNVASLWQRELQEASPSVSCSWWSKIKASGVVSQGLRPQRPGA